MRRAIPDAPQFAAPICAHASNAARAGPLLAVGVLALDGTSLRTSAFLLRRRWEACKALMGVQWQRLSEGTRFADPSYAREGVFRGQSAEVYPLLFHACNALMLV